MENFLWQKTLLDMFKNFDRHIVVADNKFNSLIAKSMYCHAQGLYDELFSTMARKNNCLTAKQLVSKGLQLLTDSGKNILYYYYIDKIPFKVIAQRECINLRQIFRNFDKEIASFAYHLSKLGYSGEIIQKEFGTDSIFVASFEKIAKKTNNKCISNVLLPHGYCDDDIKQTYHARVTTAKFNDMH